MHRTAAELEAGLDAIRQSPRDHGSLRLIVRRPAEDAREVLATGELNRMEGLAGDTWRLRPSSRTPDGSAHPDMQLNLMNSRVAALVAGPIARWPIAGDQLYVDFDLSVDNLPPGTRLAIGEAVIEVTDQPHTGCSKFAERFGIAALKFVNSPGGKLLHLRGVNAKVLTEGTVRRGDVVRKFA